MKYQIPQNIQHQIRVAINHFSVLWTKKWFKFLLINTVVFFLISRILNVYESSNNSDQVFQNQDISSGDFEDIRLFDFTYYLISKATSYQDDNRVNDFSNIGLIINPEYAKKQKIDPKIVAQKQAIVDNYIKIYTPIAKSEMKKFGIPISITLAQGLLESDAGGSRLARNNNNHFGIKCFSTTCQKGHCVNYTDDTHKDFFRNYQSSWSSFREHSILLQKPRYQSLYQLKKSDYKGWANGLQKAGYATDQKYGSKLIKIIEILELDEL